MRAQPLWLEELIRVYNDQNMRKDDSWYAKRALYLVLSCFSKNIAINFWISTELNVMGQSVVSSGQILSDVRFVAATLSADL